MKKIFSRLTALMIIAAIALPTVPVLADEQVNLGNMFGSTTFADDGTVTLDESTITKGATGVTLAWEKLADGAALKVSGITDTDWGASTIKRIWFGEMNHQYLVSAKVKAANSGATTGAFFEGSSSAASKSKLDDKYKTGAYNYGKDFAENVTADGWTEIYALYALVENDSTKTMNGVHIEIRLTSATDVYIKDFNVVETSEVDNLLLGQLDPVFESRSTLCKYSSSFKSKTVYEYTSGTEIVSETNAFGSNKYLQLSGFTDADGVFSFRFPVSAGKKYIVGMDVKLPSGGEESSQKASLSCLWLDDATVTAESEPMLSTALWKRVSYSIVSDVSDNASVNLRIAGMNSGSVLVDNIYLKEIPANSTYIVSTEPLDKAVSVPVTQKLTVKFSGAVSSFTEDNISVTGIKSDEASDDDIAVSSVTAMENNTYEIALSGVDYECKYTVELKNISGIADKSISFVTEAAPEPDNNLIADANYDFEEEIASESGYPGHCTISYKGDNVSATRVEGNIVLPAYNNNYYASVTGRKSTTDGIRFIYAPTTKINKYYRASVWVRLPERTSEAVTANISIANYSKNTVKPSTATGTKVELKPFEWVEVSHIFEVIPKDETTESHTSGGMHIELITSHTGDIHMDYVRVEEYTPQPLSISGSVPEAGATDVSIDSDFSVTFNNPLKSDLTPEQVSINNGAVVSAVNKSTYGNTYTLTIDNLCYATEYKVTVSDVTDSYGNTLESQEFGFTTCSRPAATALINNPGFEAEQNTNWYSGGGNVTGGLVERGGTADSLTHWVITSEDSYTGDYCVKSTGSEYDGCQLYYTGIPVEKNKQYVFSFAAKPNTKANVFLRQQGLTGAPAFEETRTALVSTGKWERYTVLFNTLENDYVRIYVGHNGVGTNYYDDFAVAKYDTLMEYAYSSVENGETNVPIDVNKITISMTNRIGEPEKAALINKFTVNNGAKIVSANVVSDGSVIELTFDGKLKNDTTYTISCDTIADEFGIESSKKTITFTTAPGIIVEQAPEISEAKATAVVKNCTDSPIAAPVLIYAEYDENNEVFSVKASDFDAEIPAFSEHTCTISEVPGLADGHTAMLWLITNKSNIKLLSAPVGTKPAFSTADVYRNEADPQSDTVTVGGTADENADVLAVVLKPGDSAKNAANAAAYNAYSSENKVAVQSLLGGSDSAIDEANLQDYVYHIVSVRTNENGEYSVTLPVAKTSEKTVYGVLAASGGFDGSANAVYMPSTQSYADATGAVNIGGAAADITNVLDNHAAELGISLASPVYALRKSNIIKALEYVYPQGGYTDFTDASAQKAFRTDFINVLAYYERQEESLALINTASNEGLTAILNEYADVLGEHWETPLDFNSKYSTYGAVNINRQLIGTAYASMNDFVAKFNSTVYVAPPGGNTPAGGSPGGSTGAKGAAFEVLTQPQAAEQAELFSDLAGYEWAKEAIISLAQAGVINGMGDGTFAPQGNVTREQFVKMLVLAFGIDITEADNAFADVDGSAWYAAYVSTAYKSGIVKGISDTEFGVGSHITRQDMAIMIARACELFGKSLTKTHDISFEDMHTVSEYAADAVTALAEAGIINGVADGIMAPFEAAARAQVAVILNRLG